MEVMGVGVGGGGRGNKRWRKDSTNRERDCEANREGHAQQCDCTFSMCMSRQ